MKINKNSAIACFCAMIISVVIVLVLGIVNLHSITLDTVQNILIGVFSSSIVSFVISFIGYFHERSLIMEKTENNLKNLFINMGVLCKIIGNTLQQIHNSANLSTLPFNNISGLSGLNINFLNDMNLGLFNPVFKNGWLAELYTKLLEFQQITYNIRNISMNLEAQSLEHSNMYLIMQNNQINGIAPKYDENRYLDDLKNTINIKTAKLHEYTTGQMNELEKILKTFYKCKGGKQSWEDIKSNLLIQIDQIIRR